MDEGRISSVQLMLLLYISEISTVFMIVPAEIMRNAGPDGWLSVLLFDSVYGLAVVLVAVALAKRFPQQMLTEYLPRVLGWVPGKLLALIYTGVFINLVSVVISENNLYMSSALMGQTPKLVIDLVMVVVAVYGVLLGIEVIARQNEMVFLVYITSIIALFALLVKEVNIDNLRPVLAEGIGPAVKGSLMPAAYRGEVFIMLMLYPCLNQKSEALKSAVGMLLLSAVSGSVITATTIGVFGDRYASHLVFTGHTLARYISAGGILERMELYLVMIWVAGVLIKLTVFLYLGCVSAASTLGIGNYRRVIIPVTMIVLVISEAVYNPSYLRLFGFLSRIWPGCAYAVELLIPAAVLGIAVITKRFGGRTVTDNG